jgi:trimeric autotransporter adhesin
MHKKLLNFTLLILTISANFVQAQNVGINETGATPNGSAMLDVSATSKGMLIPRLSRAQKFLIPTPANGLMIYQTDDTAGFWYYEQSKWVPVMRSITFGPGLTGGMVQGKGNVDIAKTGVIKGTYGTVNEFPIVTINDYGQVTLVAKQKLIDNDTLNEIQKIRLSNDSIFLSKGGGFVNLTSQWRTTGNSGLNASNNFIGTTDNVALRFRVNNTWYGELNPSNDNISIGYRANLGSSGYSNIAVGKDALKSNAGGYYNTAVGWQAMYDNNSGSYNCAVGASALYKNTTGTYNVGIGFEPLTANTSGSYNVGIGFRSLYYNTVGTYNSCNGIYSMYANVGGIMNTANGCYSLGGNSYGHYNTATGSYSLASNNLGYGNTYEGYGSGYYNTTGYYNTGVGYYSGYYNYTGYFNSALGYYAGTNGNMDNTTALGNSSKATASDMIRVGNASVTSIGGQVGWTTLSDARFKKNIKENVSGLDFIMKLKPVTYNVDIHKLNIFLNVHDSVNWATKYDGEKTVTSGFLAQDVEKAAKEVGYEFDGVDAPKNEKSYYGLRYGNFVVPIVKAIQEQQAQIDELKRQNQELIALNKKLLEQLKK